MTMSDPRVDVSVLSSVCLYHHKQWRCKLQNLLNQLRVRVIPVQYLHRFHSLICVCKDGDLDQQPNDFYHVIDKQFKISSIKHENTKALIEQMLKSNIWNNTDRSRRNKSMDRLIYLLHKAISNNFDMIKEKDQKDNASQVISTNVIVDVEGFSPSCLGIMIGKRGRKVKDIQRKFSCKVSLKFTDHHSCRFLACVRYPADKPSSLGGLFCHLEKSAGTIVRERREYSQRFESYLQRRLQRQNFQNTVRNKGDTCKVYNVKEANKLQYSRHRIANRKYCRKQEHVSKLVGSHCVNCLLDYTTELFQAARCKHHPGYTIRTANSPGESKAPVKYTWTCCQTEGQKSDDASEDHLVSGCTVGIHNWRPERRQQKGESKPKLKLFSPHMEW